MSVFAWNVGGGGGGTVSGVGCYATGMQKNDSAIAILLVTGDGLPSEDKATINLVALAENDLNTIYGEYVIGCWAKIEDGVARGSRILVIDSDDYSTGWSQPDVEYHKQSDNTALISIPRDSVMFLRDTTYHVCITAE